MAEDLPPDLVEQTCKQCPLFPTKQGREPAHLTFALNEVARLENRKAIGVQLSRLSPFQEAILVGAAQGRNRSDAKRTKEGSNKNSQDPNLQIPKGLGGLD